MWSVIQRCDSELWLTAPRGAVLGVLTEVSESFCGSFWLFVVDSQFILCSCLLLVSLGATPS
jgi:hypothetical protein